jgi:ADP-ribose pyrophosphatase
MIRPWQRTGSRFVGDFRVFQLREDRAVSPRTGDELPFYVIESVDWVNVIAVTPYDELVLVEQYRHGSETVELEVPGGMMDPEETCPIATGIRELSEETGYEGGDARVLGKIFPNPALQNNTCHTVLIERCQLRHPTKLDHGEDLVTRLIPFSEIPELVASGRFGHSLVVVALYYYDLYRRSSTRQIS